MRLRLGIAAVCVLSGVFGLLMGGASGEDGRKTSSDPGAGSLHHLHHDQIFNFHYHEKVKRGEFIELAQLDSQENRGRTLVITNLELRMRQSTRVQVVEHRKDKTKKRRDGKPFWNKTVRRGDGFSVGDFDSTTKWVKSGFNTLVGMKFDPGTRPSIEVTQGSGEIWIYAEGYYSRR